MNNGKWKNKTNEHKKRKSKNNYMPYLLALLILGYLCPFNRPAYMAYLLYLYLGGEASPNTICLTLLGLCCDRLQAIMPYLANFRLRLPIGNKRQAQETSLTQKPRAYSLWPGCAC